MPQPLKRNYSIQYGPNKIRERPELASEIGNICANWNLLEDQLMKIYGFLMGDYLPKIEGSAPPTHPVAYQIFDSLNAFVPRIDLLEKLLVWREKKDIVEHFRNKIRPALRARFSERSKIVHGVWGVCDNYHDALILIPTFGNRMKYIKRDFEDVSTRILAANKDLGEFLVQIYQSRNQQKST